MIYPFPSTFPFVSSLIGFIPDSKVIIKIDGDALFFGYANKEGRFYTLDDDKDLFQIPSGVKITIETNKEPLYINSCGEKFGKEKKVIKVNGNIWLRK